DCAGRECRAHRCPSEPRPNRSQLRRRAEGGPHWVPANRGASARSPPRWCRAETLGTFGPERRALAQSTKRPTRPIREPRWWESTRKAHRGARARKGVAWREFGGQRPSAGSASWVISRGLARAAENRLSGGPPAYNAPP